MTEIYQPPVDFELIKITEVSAVETAAQLASLTSANETELGLRGLREPLVQFQDTATALTSVTQAQENEKNGLGLRDTYVLRGANGFVAGLGVVTRNSSPRRQRYPVSASIPNRISSYTHVPAVGKLAGHLLEELNIEEYSRQYNQFHIKAWLDKSYKDHDLRSAYQALLALLRSSREWSPFQYAWTVEPRSSNQQIHYELAEAGFNGVKEGYFNEGTVRNHLPRAVLYLAAKDPHHTPMVSHAISRGGNLSLWEKALDYASEKFEKIVGPLRDEEEDLAA